MTIFYPEFTIGQVIHHRLFDYRGVIVDVDSTFQGTDDWYETTARSKPPRDKPWYHVLPHGTSKTTYVAEQNLEIDESGKPISHPLVRIFFDEYTAGKYHRAVN